MTSTTELHTRTPVSPRDDYDVLIVGAGTTGLALARLLTMREVRVAVVDPNSIVCHHPRASHIDDECMRLLQTLGFAEAEKDYMVMTGVEIFGADDRRLMHWEMVSGETDQGWRSDYQFFQPDFEAVLRGQLAASSCADLWLGWHAGDLTQDRDWVRLTLHKRATGEPRVVRGRYVVGCDGSNSIIRSHVAREVRDLHGTRRSMIVDVKKFVTLDALPEASTYMRSGARPFTHQPTWGGISRFQFMLLGDQDRADLDDPETVYELLAPYLAPDQYRILRTDIYQWHSRLAHGWRNGRVLIAGDAAHQMPPALGQGMCSGLRDAANLAWKLADVVHGHSGSTLLDTYESERSTHVEWMISESTRQANTIAAVGRGERMAPTGAIDRARRRLGTGLGSAKLRMRGELAPQPRRPDGVLLDDLVGYRFAVLGDRRTLEAVDAATHARWKDLTVRLVPNFSPDATAWLRGAAADAAIIRPDRYVYAATSGPEDLNATTQQLITDLGRAAAPL